MTYSFNRLEFFLKTSFGKCFSLLFESVLQQNISQFQLKANSNTIIWFLPKWCPKKRKKNRKRNSWLKIKQSQYLNLLRKSDWKSIYTTFSKTLNMHSLVFQILISYRSIFMPNEISYKITDDHKYSCL